jgi:hypothetical protein
MNEDKIINQQRNSYSKNFKEYGATPNGVYWNNTETQNCRFEKLITNFDLTKNCPSIHDVGAGICDFHNFLNEKKINHKYSGTEIVQEMINYSLAKYTGVELFNRNLVSDNCTDSYDFLFLSGTLNLLNGQENDNWKEYCYKLLKKMFSMCSKGIAFNCLTTYKTFTDPLLCYFDPAEMFDFCQKNLSRFIILDHGYPFFEFTVTVFNPDYVQEHYPDPLYSKYFSPKK